MFKQLAYEMELRGSADERSSIEMVGYSPEYQEAYKRVYNECFHEMREALGIKPYDFIQDDSFFEKGMDRVRLLLDNGEIVGSVALKEDEIDDLIVAPGYQDRGYGWQILLWALEHMESRTVRLHVAACNLKAIHLYEKAGFERTKTIVINENRKRVPQMMK